MEKGWSNIYPVEKQNHRIFWAERDTVGLPSLNLKWRMRIEPMTLVVICDASTKQGSWYAQTFRFPDL